MITDTPAVQVGIDRYEGLLVAYLPSMADMPNEAEYRDGKRTFTAVAYSGVLLDILPQDSKTVKWWLVREAARALRLREINPIWSGPAEDFRVSCLPQVPKPEGHTLAMRQYSRGPWILLEEKQQLELPLNQHVQELNVAV